MVKKQAIIRVGVSLLVLLLMYVGISQLLVRKDFYRNLLNSPLWDMTATWVAILSWFIPLLEISVALLLVWPRMQQIALSMSIAILGGYVVYSGSILYIAPYIPCSCGGMFKFLSWQQQLGLSIVFLVIAIVTLYLSNTLKKI